MSLRSRSYTCVVLCCLAASAVTQAQTATPTTLTPMTVTATGTAKPARYAKTTRFDEFYERRHTSVGGTFLTREDIEKSGKVALVDLLRGMPGVKVEQDRFGTPNVIFTRCKTSLMQKSPSGIDDQTVQLFIDGRKVTDFTTTIQLLKTGDVEAMEIYQGVASLPQAARGDGCAALFIWTRYETGEP
jgi:outer membrane cobalamin receptor